MIIKMLTGLRDQNEGIVRMYQTILQKLAQYNKREKMIENYQDFPAC